MHFDIMVAYISTPLQLGDLDREQARAELQALVGIKEVSTGS